LKYTVVVHESEYGFDVHSPALPGCNSQGDTLEETLENIKDAICTYLDMVTEETKDKEIYEVEISVCPSLQTPQMFSSELNANG